MLLAYGASNFFCFKEGFEISFRLGKSCSEKISNGKEYTNVLCVKGANASGKTNALKALYFLSDFCANSFSHKPDEPYLIEPFFSNESSSSFFIEFQIGGIEYRYELEMNKNKVFKEILFKKDERIVRVIERTNNEISYNTSAFNEIKKVKLRDNASFISTAHQYEISSIENVYDFFYKILSNVDSIGLNEDYASLDNITKYYYKNQNIFNFVKSVLMKCDLGIKDILIEERLGKQDEKTYVPIFIHLANGVDHRINYFRESSGTKSLYMQLVKYKLVLDHGAILVMDEFDIKLHPDILPILIELFIDDEVNKNDAQFLFTTHNSNVLDILGKYRTVLVNKDENESFLYRLDEISGDIIRNDRPIEPIYRTGKIGGVPRV